jgi:hypothetical protein
MVAVKEALCTNDVINIGNSRISVAFYKGRSYPVYIEDDGRSIWAFNEKGIDQMLRDFETPDTFFDNHFSIVD